MYVEVNDGYFLNLFAIVTHRVGCRHCHIINEAEAVRARLHLVFGVVGLAEDARMMTWRTCRTEGISTVLGHNHVDCFNSGSCRDQGSFPGPLRRHCVFVVKISYHFVARSLQFGDVLHHLLNVVEVVDF